MAGRIRVGIGGWRFDGWHDGAFYPPGWPKTRELEYASQHVTTIEINSTFYGPQKPATFAKWREQTPEDFVFSVKAPQRISQRRVLAETGEAVEHFIDGGLAELGDKLGPIVWQLAAGRRFDADDLAAFFALLPRQVAGRRLHHVLDLQHESFACLPYLELARRHGIGSVITDSDSHASFADLSGELVYVQLRSAAAEHTAGYATRTLAAWAKRAAVWAGGGEPDDLPRLAPAAPGGAPREVFVLFIHGAKERNPAAALALLKALGP